MITHGALTPHAQKARPCSRCFRPRLLLALVGALDLCAECWRQAGSPFTHVTVPGNILERER